MLALLRVWERAGTPGRHRFVPEGVGVERASWNPSPSASYLTSPLTFSAGTLLHSRTLLSPLGRALWWARGPGINWNCLAQLLIGLGLGKNWLASQHLSFLSCKWGNSSKVVVRMRGGDEHELSRTQPRCLVDGCQHHSPSTWEEAQTALSNSVLRGQLPGPSIICDYKFTLRGPSADGLY